MADKITLSLKFEELQKIALDIIGVVDYDIQKECECNIEDDGFDHLVDELAGFLERYVADEVAS